MKVLILILNARIKLNKELKIERQAPEHPTLHDVPLLACEFTYE